MEPCIDPTAVTQEQLGAYAADPSDAPPTVVGHIAACLGCQQEVREMGSFTAYLRQQLYRFDCPPPENLTALVAGTLEAARGSIDAHMLTCTRCQEELSLVTAALADHDPILDWQAPTAVSGARRLLASLLEALPPGIAAPAPALNLRSAGAGSPTRPRIYHAEDVTLALRVTPAAHGHHHLEGMLSSASEPTLAMAEIPVRLYVQEAAAPPRLVAEDTTEGGTFLLGPFPSGHYELEVHLTDRIIAVEDLVW
ncbi:MAG: hypothetical protein H0X24_06365 [Ktedonobacterales bacterium]|nr:hypothetical protein [Ktedonobacterales bacterium]